MRSRSSRFSDCHAKELVTSRMLVPQGLGDADWGIVDLLSIGIGVLVLMVFLATRKKCRTMQGVTALLASGISLGPLLLILADPFAQLLGFRGLLEAALAQGRVTLWWAAAVATLYVVRGLF
ncbi:hypothetical protein ACELLULO517_11975 [Acidisoma cellulosilytica]|uniref:Uncharacterized protein n=1 Tax=Acidisoma cellulosilyticum TaxID=2802395 RepID=A0A963Z1F8_9PROT|nr:hypothetical protein [Acidisoma cellulosilyticum]MCB8880954.1 hypothetical protein [Acidisoma cellulosilyticum]